MLAADARAGAVVVRTLPADQVLGIGRPSLGQRAPVAAPGPTGGALRMECGNTVYPPSYDGARQWGGYPNGLIPPSAMCPLGVAGHVLRCDAAAAYRAMSAAFATAFGSPICITDSYRTYASQVRLYGEKPTLAAVPGTSNHGWGLAVDLCGGIEHYGTAAVQLDEGQRRPLRLPAPRLGRARPRSRGAVALGVRGHLSRPARRNCRWPLLPCGQLTEERIHADRLRHLHRARHRLRRLRRHRPARGAARAGRASTRWSSR